MDLIQLFERYRTDECTHDELIRVVFSFLSTAEWEDLRRVDELLIDHFPMFRSQKGVLTVCEDKLPFLPIGTLVHGLYEIQKVLKHTSCFFRYQVRCGDKSLVLSILNPVFFEAEYEEFFLREKTLSSSMKDIPIRCVHCCTDREYPFLVYDAQMGISLKEYLVQHRPLTLPFTRRLALQLCSVVTHFHASMMSHWGIHMDSITLFSEGFFLNDFGLESRLCPIPNEIQQLRYRAPEQFNRGYLDAKTDVYALGILLYRLYAGHFPFPDKTKEGIRDWHLNGERSELSFSKDVQHDIQVVIVKALHVEPMLRFDSAQLLKEALYSATSRMGWYVFDRGLLERLRPRLCHTHVFSEGDVCKREQSILDSIGDLFPTWRLYQGSILLSVHPLLIDEQQGTPQERFSRYNIADLDQTRPITYQQLKILQYLGAEERMYSLIVELEEEGIDDLLLAYVYSSLCPEPKRVEEFLAQGIAKSSSFLEVLSLAVFACWHRLDEVMTRKLLLRLETLCSDSESHLFLAQAWGAFLDDEEEIARQLLRYVHSFSESTFAEQYQALLKASTPFGKRPELVRWTIRLEEEATDSDFLLLSDLWNRLDVPKRAQKMVLRHKEGIREQVQKMMQRLVSLEIPIPSFSHDIDVEVQDFLKEGARLYSLGIRRREILEKVRKENLSIDLFPLSLDEQELEHAEKRYEEELVVLRTVTECTLPEEPSEEFLNKGEGAILHVKNEDLSKKTSSAFMSTGTSLVTIGIVLGVAAYLLSVFY